jgi:uncharacterized RDD family membrane protein YckC
MTQPPSGRIAPISRRAIAYLIDALIAAGIAIVPSVIVFAVFTATASSATTAEGALGSLAVLAIGFPIVGLLALGWFVFYTVMQSGRGSIGMRAQGLRLVGEDGAPLGFGRTLLRNVIFGLSAGIVVGYFTPLFDGSGRFQGWHDKVAKSLMYDARTDAVAPDAPATAAAPAAPGFAAPAVPTAPFAPPVPGLAAPGAPAPQAPSGYAVPQEYAAPGTPVDAPASPFARPEAPVAPQAPVAPVVPAAPAFAAPPAPALPTEPAVPARPDLPAMPAHAPASIDPAVSITTTPPAPVADDGVIAYVPGITLDSPPPRPAAEAPVDAPAQAPDRPAAPAFPGVPPAPAFPVAPAADVPAPAPAAPMPETPEPATAATAASATDGLDDDLEETRISIPGHRLVFTWDDGTRVTVSRRTVFGRNPEAEDGVIVVPVRDETLSLSKTHFEAAASTSGGWVLDRFSTNGVTLVRDGQRIACPAGQRVPVRLGDALEIGDRIVTIGGYA